MRRDIKNISQCIQIVFFWTAGTSAENEGLAVQIAESREDMDVCTENDESGLVAAEKIKKTMPQIKVIIVTSLVECSFIDRARKVGVESFWYKDAGKEELLEVMDRTMKGENVYPDAPPVVMIGTAKSCDFTPGELAVLRLVVEGESYKKIAESLCISPETVKWHIKNMLQKTNFDSKTKLAVAVTKKNLIINGF